MPTFKSIHTAHGLQRMAAAEAAGQPINIVEMAVGDGNGNPVDIDDQADATGLVRERFRAEINRVYADPERDNRYSAELIIPASVGGFTLREIGIFDEQGGLFAVGNLPETYKPSDSEGAFADTVVRFEFLVTNASVVTLQIDPNVAVATHTWIINNVTMATLLPGGTTGQIAKKASNADGDIVWSDPDDINITVNTIDEEQTLADSQTLVDLAVVTTRGLAVYVDGLRLYEGAGANRWQKAPEPDSVTRIVLGQSYPGGTKLIAAQNEPTGFAPSPLERSKNLSDLDSRPAARANLDVFSKAETRHMAPSGMIAHFARNTAPTGWLKANGAAVSRSAYADLFAAIGTAFGAGNGFTTFNLPDLRGEFLRGWDDGRGADGGREFGSSQAGELQSHAHQGSAGSAGAHAHTGTAATAGSHSHGATTGLSGHHNHRLSGQAAGGGGRGLDDESQGSGWSSDRIEAAGNHTHSVSIGTGGAHTHTVSVGSAGTHNHSIEVEATGGSETRPRNMAMLGCIKF
ncbi:Phage Tail Collar Domain [Halopseudomonas litoralis]|uniref:Phage Tail Collar Domain n=1 Tax=Halopseudomonas litoralis TaxID=797277 RepID=A0A1H1SN51_9GAMM|nr:phage tail protein [Halopseudomonas litoralis]SDS49283.1 Phage Tail Collar Domain [Halopseudomonas litoralis]